jgi:S-DNA-T family DNA segregation ATPase FtsK/SpoIIIE
MDMLEQNGYITSANGSKPREVLITEAELQSMQD